jgi:putative hemolysin
MAIGNVLILHFMKHQEKTRSPLADEKKFINVEGIIRKKNPGLFRVLPGFIIRYLKKIVHEDDINGFINRNGHLFGLDFVDAIIREFLREVVVDGQENIPAEGRWIIASNHPLGGLDGIALMQTAGKARKDIVFPVNDLLMNLENLRPLFIPVNKHGSNAQNARIIEESFASDVAMLYFPAGLVSRRKKGGIKDLEWKKTVISKARKHKRDVIPAHIGGRNSGFFYSLANTRKFFGVKANIEMLYLPDEMYKQQSKRLRITIGKSIPWETFDKRHSDAQWAALLRDHVYQLPLQKDLVFPY